MTSNYWLDRVGRLFAGLDVSDAALSVQLNAEYQKAYHEINRLIYDFYERYADDNKLSYDEARKRVRSVNLDDYVAKANEYRKANKDNPEALKRLNAQLATSKINRLELLKYQIELELIKSSTNRDELFSEYLKKQSEYIYKRVSDGKVSGANLTELQRIVETPWSGANYSERLWRNTDLLAQQLKDLLVRNAINGQNPKVIAKEIRRRFDVSNKISERLVRTESTVIANGSIAQRYKDLGLKEYEFSAHLDGKTSDACKNLNGKVFKLKDYASGINAPAMHPNCRSRIVPSDNELSEMDKYLDTTY